MKSLVRTVAGGLALSLGMGAGSVLGQEKSRDVLKLYERLYVDPSHFSVNSDADIDVVDVDEVRMVRFCLDVSEHRTPLEIKYAEHRRTLQPGNCMVVEAKEIAIGAGAELKEGWSLTGTYDVSR